MPNPEIRHGSYTLQEYHYYYTLPYIGTVIIVCLSLHFQSSTVINTLKLDQLECEYHQLLPHTITNPEALLAIKTGRKICKLWILLAHHFCSCLSTTAILESFRNSYIEAKSSSSLHFSQQ